jgi:predicted Zn-dependent protease
LTAGDILAEINSGPADSLAISLRNAARFLEAQPDLAEKEAREILLNHPDDPRALLILAQSLAAQGDFKSSRAVLLPLAAKEPENAAVQAALGTLHARAGETAAALTALSRAVEIDPSLAHVWRKLMNLRLRVGDSKGADAAYARYLFTSVKDPQLLVAARALCDNRLAVAEDLLREFLISHPDSLVAIRTLAETVKRSGRFADAEKLLARCLELSPGSRDIRQNYANILHQQYKFEEAIAQTELLLKDDPRDFGMRSLKASAFSQIGEEARAAVEYELLLKEQPGRSKLWMRYGHTLKALGRQEECVAAYRRSIALLPGLGEAWWSLANLKTYRLTADDVVSMEAVLSRGGLSDADRSNLHFTLGKALEDQRSFARSFEHYREGNRLRRKILPYDAAEFNTHVRRSQAFFTPAFFAERSGMGCRAQEPIFIVGLPRAGSTLVEQILASHSQVEGTRELSDIVFIARRLGGQRNRDDVSNYPEILGRLSPGDLNALGEEYIACTRVHRRLGRPFFIDKLPSNFEHVGLIHLILPNAKIIDVRRYPLACCYSVFKQNFALGKDFSYDLADIGQYYADYVALMAHFDAVLPGKIHRVVYERLVNDPEHEVRQLLAYCGIPFEEACLRFHENARPVRTASSEQVRLPIFKDSLDDWREYEAWLEPLKTVLAPVLATYPEAPALGR